MFFDGARGWRQKTVRVDDCAAAQYGKLEHPCQSLGQQPGATMQSLTFTDSLWVQCCICGEQKMLLYIFQSHQSLFSLLLRGKAVYS